MNVAAQLIFTLLGTAVFGVSLAMLLYAKREAKRILKEQTQRELEKDPDYQAAMRELDNG
jgi:hypothetical protein